MILFVIYHLWYIYYLPYETIVHAIVHLGSALVIILALNIKNSKNILSASIWSILIIFVIISTIYLFTHYAEVLANPSNPPLYALITASGVTIICFIIVRKSFGLVFPIIGIFAILYVAYGDVLPGFLSAPSTSLRRTITLLAADITSPWGSYGSLVELSANYLFLFIAFGAILNAFGGLKFAVHIGNLAANKLRSGPAALSIISSALLGSVTGSSAANITVTGSFTIPLMKRTGYLPHQAAAIEAAASNGGQFLPPIMGATVFVMAAYTGIPYIDIMFASLIPALIYFVTLLIYAELNAIKLNIPKQEFKVDFKSLIIDGPRFFIPFAVLVTLLLQGYSLMFVIFWSILVVISLGVIYNMFKSTRISLNDIISSFSTGIITGCNVAAVLALVGVIVAAIEITGLSLKLSVMFGGFAGDNIFLTLILTMLISLILGIGLPTPAAYVIVATVISPILIKAGIPLLQSHLFPLFYAVFSHLTPPIGIGLLLASRLADASFYKSAIEVFKAAFVAIFIPFLFIYSPEILLKYSSYTQLISTTFAILVLFFTLSVFVNNQFAIKLSLSESIISFISVLFLLYFVIADKYIILIIGTIICILLIYLNIYRSIKLKTQNI